MLNKTVRKMSKVDLVRHFATFMSTHVYAELVAEVRSKGTLPTSDDDINRLIENARERSLHKFEEAITQN